MLVVLLLVAAGGTSAAVGTTFTVNSTANAQDANLGNSVCAYATGACTLPAAIQESNASADSKDTIAFAIPGPGPHVVVLAAGFFPTVTDAVVIDGRTQPGACRDPALGWRGAWT